MHGESDAATFASVFPVTPIIPVPPLHKCTLESSNRRSNSSTPVNLVYHRQKILLSTLFERMTCAGNIAISTPKARRATEACGTRATGYSPLLVLNIHPRNLSSISKRTATATALSPCTTDLPCHHAALFHLLSFYMMYISDVRWALSLS